MNTQAINPRMDANSHQRAEMLTEVDFKWLMAGLGFWVDPTQLHRDPGYAQASLQNALHSGCEALCRCAVALRSELEQESQSRG